MASDDCLSASLIRWRGPRGTPRACALGAAARQAPDHAACVPAQRRTGGLGAQAAHPGRDAPADRAALAGGRAQEQGRSQDVPSARHPSVKRRRPDRDGSDPDLHLSPRGVSSRRASVHSSIANPGWTAARRASPVSSLSSFVMSSLEELMRERMSGSSQLESECDCARANGQNGEHVCLAVTACRV